MKLSSFDKRYLCPNSLHVVPCTMTFELKVFNLIIYGEWSSLLWWNSTIKGLKGHKPISSTLPSLSGEILLCRKSDWYVLTEIFSLFELCLHELLIVRQNFASFQTDSDCECLELYSHPLWGLHGSLQSCQFCQTHY